MRVSAKHCGEAFIVRLHIDLGLWFLKVYSCALNLNDMLKVELKLSDSSLVAGKRSNQNLNIGKHYSCKLPKINMLKP